jgi:SAM-dependent methyltransferase
MTNQAAIIGMGDWLETPPGHHLMAWEQGLLDEVVADVFGYHALQLGLPELDALRANRMPHRWVGHTESPVGLGQGRRVGLHCLPEALPFPGESLDLVVLPHTLELSDDPHQCLAEAVRVLRPEGRVVICGFNPASLWRWRREGLPTAVEWLHPRRVRDWLRLLSCELAAQHHGLYRPPFHTPGWLVRSAWMEAWGARWWPPFGAAYMIVAIKRVRGMRWVGLARTARQTASSGRAVPVLGRVPRVPDNPAP